MKSNGLFASIEATLSLLMLIAVVVSMPRTEQPNLETLHILQKEHDLLLIWAKTWPVQPDEMEGDFRKLFPGKNGAVELNTDLREIGALEGEIVSSEMHFLDRSGNWNRVVVYVVKKNKPIFFS